MKRAFAVLLSAVVCGSAQTPKPVPARFSGCVTATPDDASSFVLSGPEGCSLITGKFAGKKLAGHTIVLRGSLLPTTATDPQTIVVEGVESVGAACQETCTLEPPGHRGLKRKPKEGTPGGTPGY